MNDLISIIIPVYNGESFISDTIESVLHQTYLNWELMLIDDCSTDKSQKIMMGYANKDSRIHIYKNTRNLGVVESRNFGINRSNGRWIAFLDSDDIWVKAKLQKQMQLVKDKNAEFVYTASRHIDAENLLYSGWIPVPLSVKYNKLLYNNVIPCSSVLINKKLMERYPMSGEDFHEDYLTWLRILKSGVTAYGINEPCLLYRVHENSRSAKKSLTIKKLAAVLMKIGIRKPLLLYYLAITIINKLIKLIRIGRITTQVVSRK